MRFSKSLGGRESYINGAGKNGKVNKKRRYRVKKLHLTRKNRILTMVIVMISLVSTLYLLAPGYVQNYDVDRTYGLVELKTPSTLQELKDSGVEIVHVYGYYALVKYSEKQVVRGIEIKPIHYFMWYQTGIFTGIEGIPQELSKGFDNTNLFIVQLVGPATPQWLNQMKGEGAHIISYYPQYSYLIKIDNQKISGIRDDSFVKAVYPYQPLWKMHLSLYREMMNGNLPTLKLKINVDPSLDISKMANKLATTYNAKILKYFIYPKYNLAYVVAEVPRYQVSHILQEDFVLSADIKHEIHLTNSVAARIIGAAELRDSWRNGLKLPVTGDGQVVEIADTGLDTGNPNNLIPDFAARVTTIYDAADDGDPSDPDSSDLGGHGTHVAGSVASSGVMSGSDPSNHIYDGTFAGMAPEAQIHFEAIGTYDSQYGWILNYDSITGMADRGYNDGARIWTNSWGSSSNTYTSDSDEVDTYMWNNKDFLILFAAGNSGPGANTIGSPATAKNIITVGATETLRLEVNSQGTFNAYSMAQNPEQLAYFSSRGPTADGLIKPDVCAPGAGVVSDRPSTLSDSNAGYTWIVPIDSNGDGKYDYGAMQGTSMATPVTAGAMVLVRDYYTDVEGLSDPSAALLKATAIGGAEPMPGYKYHGIDQGYGRINIARALIPPPPLSYRYWDWQSVNNGQSWSQTIEVKTSEAPLRIVLAWTDVNSGNGAGVAKNNLDLRVIAPDGTEYHGNTFIGDTQWSQENPSGYDSTNVVEVVNVKEPQVGTWTIQIIGASIGTDDSDGPGSLDQTFAIYALGPFGPQKFKNVRVERYAENSYGGEYKNFTHMPIQKVLVAGQSFIVPFRVVNWGDTTLTYSIQSEVIPDTTDITVAFDKSSVTLNPEHVAWINASISTASGTNSRLYEIRLEAVNSDNNLVDSIIINLQVVPDTPIWHKQVTRTNINEATSAIKVDPSDGSLWIAFFRQNSSTTGNIHYSQNGNGDAYDLIVAHSTNGGKTWTEYVAYANVDRFYNYGGTMEQTMDWFIWFPRMDVDSNGKVYVAFSNITSLIVVYGDESGWSHVSFEKGHISQTQQVSYPYVYITTEILMVYPMLDVKVTNGGTAYVVYTYRCLNYTDTYRYTLQGLQFQGRTINAQYRVLKYTYTTNGGSSWTTPTFVGSYSTSDTNDEREYFPSMAYDGYSLYVFFSYRDPSNSESNYYIRYYKYIGGSWSSATTIYGSGTDGGNDVQPSGYIDSSGRIWVAWYSEDDGQNSHFGVTEHKIYLMHSSNAGSSWNEPIKIDASVPGLDINDYGPVPIGEDSSGNIVVGFVEENSYYTNTLYNDKWVHYRYSMKIATINSATGSILGYKYIDYGGQPNYWLAGDSYEGAMYFSYTKSPERYDLEVFFAKYKEGITDDMGPTTFGAMITPYNSNNASTIVYLDLVYSKTMQIKASLTDVESGNSNIAAAEYFVDTIGIDGAGISMNAEDGSYDSPVETAVGNINLFSLTRGYHRIYVHSRDSAGNWGSYDYIDIYIFASKFKVYGWVNDSADNPLEDIAVNITNENTGENVTVYTNADGYYEYYIDQLPHAYSVGDTISVYADDGSDPGNVDGTYYDTNSTVVSSAPGDAKLNLKLVIPIPELGDMVFLLLPLMAIFILRRRKRN